MRGYSILFYFVLKVKTKWSFIKDLLSSQGPKGQKIGAVRIACRFMVTYIKTFNGVLPLI